MRAVSPQASLVAVSMLAGAAYDAAFGAVILAAPEDLAPVLGLPLPADQFYLRFIGVFLFGLAIVYALPARHPDRYRGVVTAAVVIRLMGCLYLTGAAVLFARPPVFLLLAAADGGFALLHAVGLWLRPAPRDLPL